MLTKIMKTTQIKQTFEKSYKNNIKCYIYNDIKKKYIYIYIYIYDI